MMRFRILALSALATVLLVGCASEIMKSYVGKSMTEPILDYGQPTAVFDMPDGKRAFQWKMDVGGVMPVTVPTTTNIYGTGGYATATSTTTSYIPYSNECVYTLFGEKSGNDWVVVGFRKPRIDCE